MITTINFETKDGKKITLTMDEALELYRELHKLFGNKSNFNVLNTRSQDTYGPLPRQGMVGL